MTEKKKTKRKITKSRKPGRCSKTKQVNYTKDQLLVLIPALRTFNYSPPQMAWILGVNPRTMQKYIKAIQDMHEIEKSNHDILNNIKAGIFQRAAGYSRLRTEKVYKPVKKDKGDKEIVGDIPVENMVLKEHRVATWTEPPDVKAAEFALFLLDKELYKEYKTIRNELTGKDGNPIEFEEKVNAVGSKLAGAIKKYMKKKDAENVSPEKSESEQIREKVKATTKV